MVILPIDKGDTKKRNQNDLERISFEHNQSQLFIETPYTETIKCLKILYQSLRKQYQMYAWLVTLLYLRSLLRRKQQINGKKIW